MVNRTDRPRLRPWLIALLLCALTAGCAPAESSGEAAPKPQEPSSKAEADLPPMKNAKRAAPGWISAGQPTREELEQLPALGYVAVINMRPLGEDGAWDEAGLVEELGMRFVHLPVGSSDDFSRANVERFDAALRETDGPGIVHCASGNRVGGFFALRAHWIDGVPADEALEIGRRAGMSSSESIVRAQLGLDADIRD